jgi:SAM-dependent methyltransferase
VSIDFEGIKEGQRRMWASGDYPDVARTIMSAAEMVIERAEPAAGMSLLDVATGSGNVAIGAAAAGASVTGLDITPSLLEAAGERARKAGVEVRLIEGDAEALPFEDASFDCVTSCFGVIFAPRQQIAASELVRVARPGARIVFAAWTPEGLNGTMFRTIGAHLPPPPPELKSPVMWGDEDHVRSLFADSGAQLTFERQAVTFEHDSPEGWLQYNERVLGPTIMAKAALEPQGKWEPLRGELVELYSGRNEADDGSFRARAEYLLGVAEMPN